MTSRRKVIKTASTRGSDPAWLTFERAVTAFLQALDPSATVRHNVVIPDIDTNEPRQRDAWIETSFGGHLRITILVSCKRKKSKLSQQDLDAFIGELRSSGANKGVLYSFAGFSRDALRKAERLGISCCVLYEDRPPDMPSVLGFQSYHLTECFQLELTEAPEHPWSHLPGLLDKPVRPGGPTYLAELASRYDDARKSAMDSFSIAQPPTWRASIDLSGDSTRPPMVLSVVSSWRVFEARLDAWLLNGSYSFTDGRFAGSFSTPAIDRLSAPPGPGWTEIGPSEMRATGNLVCSCASGGDLEAAIQDYLSQIGPSSAPPDAATP